jgi:hypothetical protein
MVVDWRARICEFHLARRAAAIWVGWEGRTESLSDWRYPQLSPLPWYNRQPTLSKLAIIPGKWRSVLEKVEGLGVSG